MDERHEARAIMSALAAYAVGEVAGQHGVSRPWLEAQLGYTLSSDIESDSIGT